jgi:adiponectin receptor
VVGGISLSPKFATPAYRPVRATVFVAFGLSIAVPFMHWFFTSGQIDISLMNVSLVGLFYVGGAMLYAARIPERFFPGKCDYLFQSHQIFHICVVAAAVLHYLNIHDIASLSAYGDDAVCEGT